MDSFAHGLAAAAAAITINRLVAATRPNLRVGVGTFAFWGMFPDVLAFGPGVLAGLWLRASSGAGQGTIEHGGYFAHVHLGLPLYAIGHSLLVFALAFGVVALFARRPVYSVSGWLMHILFDIPTHSFQYYATRFLWPLSDAGFDGIPWWSPWLLFSTYAMLAIVYLILWRKGWVARPQWLVGRRAAL